MNNVLQVLRVKKYFILGVIALVVLLGSNIFFIAQNMKPPVKVLSQSISTTDQSLAVDRFSDINFENQEATPISSANGVQLDLLHANCIKEIQYQTEPTEIYNPGGEYNLSFMYGTPNSTLPGGLNGFYDINGDNLPDYVYSRSYTIEGNPYILESHFEGCVYLHNGNGWTKAYACIGTNQVDRSNGDILMAQYYGDCAGKE